MILAIDPSINETGYAFGSGEKPEESGVIRTKGKTDAEKLDSLVGQLDAIIERARYGGLFVTVVLEVPEGFTYSRSSKHGKSMNAMSMMKLSRAIGVILLHCFCRGYKVEEVPASWKGKAGKKLVKAITGCKNHNTADAILLYQWWSAGQPSRCPVD